MRRFVRSSSGAILLGILPHAPDALDDAPLDLPSREGPGRTRLPAMALRVGGVLGELALDPLPQLLGKDGLVLSLGI